jgi:hypothetical protein
MVAQVVSDLDSSPRTKRAAAAKPERVEAACLQEQFTGPVPARTERPFAEILAERLAETDPASPSPVFIP